MTEHTPEDADWRVLFGADGNVAVEYRGDELEGLESVNAGLGPDGRMRLQLELVPPTLLVQRVEDGDVVCHHVSADRLAPPIVSGTIARRREQEQALREASSHRPLHR